MFLHNFWEMIRATFAKTSFVTTNASGTVYGTFCSIKWKGWYPNATPRPYYMFPLHMDQNTPTANNDTKNAMYEMIQTYKWSSACVGTSDAEVNYGDYQLGTDVTSSFTNVVLTQALQSTDDGHVRITIQWTGTNTTNSTITIKEFGLYHRVYLSGTQNQSYSSIANWRAEALCVRHILTDPVTIEAGNTGSVILTIDLF